MNPRIECGDFQGADKAAKYQLLAVSRAPGDGKFLKLVDGKDVRFTIDEPGIVECLDTGGSSWAPNDHDLLLSGRREGLAHLTVKDQHNRWIEDWLLEVGNTIEFRIECHIVRGWKDGSTQTDAGILAAFEVANQILGPQANVQLVAELGAKITHPGMGRPVIDFNSRSPKPVIRKHMRQQKTMLGYVRGSSNHLQAFFVKTINEVPRTGDVWGYALKSGWPKSFMVIEDRSTPADLGRTIAHEFAHLRFLNHNNDVSPARTDILMKGDQSANSTTFGLYLNKAEIRQIRGGAKPN